MFLFRISLVVTLFFHFLMNPVMSEKKGIIFFKGTLEEALNEARDNNKLVLIDAFTTWCVQCKRMEKKVFTSEEVGDFYNKHFVNLKVDMEKGIGKDLAKNYDINAYPTIIILKPDGSILAKHMGYMDRKSLIEFGNKSFEEWQSHSF